jgi:hypothetical protein
MPVRMYQRQASGAEIKFWVDPAQYVKADMPGQIQVLEDVLALSNDIKTWIIQNGMTGFTTIQEFDDFIEAELWKLKDILDYFDYQAEEETLWNYKYMWMTPEAVESFCGEDVTDPATNAIDDDPATNAIDDDPATRWHHSTNEVHTIVFRLRTYPKKLTGVRIMLYSGSPAEHLRNVTIKAARDISQIDEASNIMATGVDFATDAQWNEHIFASAKHNARYIKLEINSTDHAANNCRIREFDAKVETIDYS